jgi:hypothetical protein
MILGKQAACLRTVGSRNPDPKIAELEAELKELGNTIGMGAMGFMGSSMVVDCHIEVGYCHTGGMPHERAHVLPVLAPRHRARFPTAAPSSAPIPNGSPTTCAGLRSSGSGRRRRMRRMVMDVHPGRSAKHARAGTQGHIASHWVPDISLARNSGMTTADGMTRDLINSQQVPEPGAAAPAGAYRPCAGCQRVGRYRRI